MLANEQGSTTTEVGVKLGHFRLAVRFPKLNRRRHRHPHHRTRRAPSSVVGGGGGGSSSDADDDSSINDVDVTGGFGAKLSRFLQRVRRRGSAASTSTASSNEATSSSPPPPLPPKQSALTACATTAQLEDGHNNKKSEDWVDCDNEYVWIRNFPGRLGRNNQRQQQRPCSAVPAAAATAAIGCWDGEWEDTTAGPDFAAFSLPRGRGTLSDKFLDPVYHTAKCCRLSGENYYDDVYREK